MANTSDVFAVEKILTHKKGYFSNLYLVKWKGYSAKHNSWEPEEHFKLEDIREYMDRIEQNRISRTAVAEKRKHMIEENEKKKQVKRKVEAIKREERVKRRNANKISNNDDCKTVSSTNTQAA